MRLKLTLIFLFVCAVPAFSQNSRYDAPLTQAPNTTIQVCSSPANGVPCSNLATTYNSAGVACPSGKQDTPQPDGTPCQAGPAQGGQIGFWAPSGTYAYTWCTGTSCFGPITITLGGTGNALSLKTNNVANGSQSLLNLQQGSNVTLTDNGSGQVTIAGSGGAPGAPVNSLQGNNASALGGIPNTSADFTTGRVDVNNLSATRYVTPAFNWSNTPGGSYTGASPATLTLPTGPLGVSGSDTNLYVYISGGTGTAEATVVTGGTCTPGASSCTLLFTPANNHTGAFTVGSASTGIYEALRDCQATNNNNCSLKLSPTNPPTANYYSVYAHITVAGGNIDIDGNKAVLDVETARAAFVMPTINVGSVHIHGFRVSTKAVFAGATVTQTACATNAATITSTLNPPVGRVVDVQMTRNQHYWGPHTVATTSGSSWTYTDTNCGGATTIASQTETFAGNAPQFAFVEDNGQGNEFNDITLDSPSGFQSHTLNNLFVILGDQKTHIHDVQLNSSLSGCTTAYCANGIYAPGTFATNPAIIDADNLGFSMFCNGNGITDYSGNTLRVSDSVIQSFMEWGTNAGVQRGGFGGTELDNVYNEVGACANPWYVAAGISAGNAIAATGLIQYDKSAIVHGGEQPGGLIPAFANTGTTQYIYWLVVHDTTVSQVSYPYELGTALSNGSGSIVVGWPQYIQTSTAGGGAPSDTITYDVLRTTYSGAGQNNAPFGTGNFAVSTGVAQCSQAICTATDTNGALSSYTVAAETNNNLTFFWWPGAAFLPSGASLILDSYGPNLQQPIIAPSGWKSPVIFAHDCVPGVNGGLMYVSCLGTSTAVNNAPWGTSTVLQVGPWSGSETANLKGRLNFFRNPATGTNTGHIITLVDSSPSKTEATFGNRPANDANDTFIGLDSGSVGVASAGLTVGAPVSISEYIANIGDGSAWQERLTATLKTIKPPIDLPEQAAPANPSSGTERLYTDSTTHTVKCLTSTGGNCLVTAGSGASPILATVALSPNCPVGSTTGGCYYTPANTQVIQNCTFNTGTANVVCASGTFASTDVGKYIWGFSTCNPFTAQPSAIYTTLTHNTISSFVDSTTVTMNAVGASGTTTTGCIVFGTPDDTAAAAVDTAFASLATTPFCPKLELAAGGYMYTTPHHFTNPVGCAASYSQAGGGSLGNLFYAAGFELEGRGAVATTIFVPPDFPETGSCTHGVNSTACFAVPLEGRFSNFSITCGNGKCGATSIPNSNAIINVDVGSLDYFTCSGIADVSSGFTHTGVQATHWAQLTQVNVSACGDQGISVTGTAAVTGIRVSSENATSLNAGSSNLFSSSGATFTCYDCKFFGSQVAASNIASIISLGSTINLYRPSIQTGLSTTATAYQCLTTNGCILKIIDGSFAPNGTTNSTGIFCNVTCTIDLWRTSITAAGTGKPFSITTSTTSQLINRGGNAFSGGAASANSGFTLNLDSQGTTSITAAKAVLSGGWGSTAAWSALNGGNTFTGTITSSGTGQGASPTITYTFPTAEPVGYIPYCHAEQTGGTQAQGTFTVGSVTATGAVFTYSGTPIAANTVFVQILCQ